MKWISVQYEGWARTFIVITSHLGETRRYFGYTKREAERRYRAEFGLEHIPLARIND